MSLLLYFILDDSERRCPICGARLWGDETCHLGRDRFSDSDDSNLSVEDSHKNVSIYEKLFAILLAIGAIVMLICYLM